MVARPTIGFVGAAHVSGNPFTAMLAPGGLGATDGIHLPAGLQWGSYGHARIQSGVTATATTLPVDTLASIPAGYPTIQGASSGATARIVGRSSTGPVLYVVVLSGTFTNPESLNIVGGASGVANVNGAPVAGGSATLTRGMALESIDTLRRVRIVEVPFLGVLVVELSSLMPPATGWFNQGEIMVADNAGVPVTTVYAYGGELPEFTTSGITVQGGGQSQHLQELRAPIYTQFHPADPTFLSYYDRNAQLASDLPVSTTAGIDLFDRVVDATTGARGLVVGSTGGNTLHLADVSGTFGSGNNLNIHNGAAAVATVTGALLTHPVGEWVPYTVRPNLAGLGARWNVVPWGSDTCYRLGSIGIEPYLMREAVARYGSDVKALKFDSDGIYKVAITHNTGGVCYGHIPCTGTFPSNWQLGEQLSNGSGWTAELVAYDVAGEILHVRKVSGTLAQGQTVTGATSGAQAEADDNVRGFMKGAKYWTGLIADITDAESKLTGGDTFDWKAIFATTFPGDIQIPPLSATSLGLTLADLTIAYQQWTSDLRHELGNDGLVVVHMAPHIQHRSAAYPLHAGVLRQALLAANTLDPKTRNYPMDDFEFQTAYGGQVSESSRVFYETMAYPLAGRLAWDVFLTATLQPAGTDLGTVPVVLLTGQSQIAALASYQWFVLEDDPELGKLESAVTGTIDTRDPDIQIWNPITSAWESYSVFSNANTFGALPGSWSMEASLLNRLKTRYGRIYCIKVGLANTSMTSLNLDAHGSWAEFAQTMAVEECTVTVTGSVARFESTESNPAFANFVAGRKVEIEGALAGTVGGGGNNTAFAIPLTIVAVDPGGTWIDVGGSFVTDAAPRTITFRQSPMNLRRLAGKVIADALESLLVVHRKVPRGILKVVWQGESDIGFSPGYQANLQSHIAWCDEVFAHRVAGEVACPQVILKLTDKTPLDTSPGRAESAAIRAAQDAVATAVANCAVVETSDLPLKGELAGTGNWPRLDPSDYGVHHTGRAAIIAGFRVDLALDGLGGVPPQPEGVAAVLELGSGGSTSTDEDGGETAEAAAEGATAEAATLTVEELDDILAVSPDVASYTLPDGRSVTRRSIDELLKLERHLDARKARAAGLRRTRAYFP